VALVGAVVGNLLGGGAMSLPALLGLFLVLGLSARAFVLLVCGYRRAEEADPGEDRATVVLRVTRERLSSLLLTAAAVAAVFIPMAVAGSRAGTEVLSPMAAVVLGGVVTSTLLALGVLPALYLRLSSAVTLTGRPSWGEPREETERAVVSTSVGGA
jgi:Cu/Ag efflux pump CusA